MADELVSGIANHGEVGVVGLQVAAVRLADNGDAAGVGAKDLGQLLLAGSQRNRAHLNLFVQLLFMAYRLLLQLPLLGKQPGDATEYGYREQVACHEMGERGALDPKLGDQQHDSQDGDDVDITATSIG